MAQIFQCDRCGELIKGVGDTLVLGPDTLRVQQYDLCSECSFNFSQFIKAKTQTEKDFAAGKLNEV